MMMKVKWMVVTLTFAGVWMAGAELPADEAGAAAYLESKGAKFKLDGEGRPVRLQHGGKPAMTMEEYALIGRIASLEQVALNGAPLEDGQWGFAKQLPNLKSFTVWHAGKFSTLENFSNLPIESLTVGGCVGVTRLPETPEGKRNGVLTLTGLPKLKRLSLYHSPLAPDDEHLAHVAKEFPVLEDLRLDFKAPRGQETSITAEGLKALAALPLRVLTIENFQTFTPAHLESIAAIETLKTLKVDARKQPVPEGLLDGFQAARPDVEIDIQSAR